MLTYRPELPTESDGQLDSDERTPGYIALALFIQRTDAQDERYQAAGLSFREGLVIDLAERLPERDQKTVRYIAQVLAVQPQSVRRDIRRITRRLQSVSFSINPNGENNKQGGWRLASISMTTIREAGVTLTDLAERANVNYGRLWRQTHGGLQKGLDRHEVERLERVLADHQQPA